MFSHYFNIGLRTLLREKSYSLINTAGLSIGIACRMISGLYLIHELTFDRYHRRLHHDGPAVVEDRSVQSSARAALQVDESS